MRHWYAVAEPPYDTRPFGLPNCFQTYSVMTPRNKGEVLTCKPGWPIEALTANLAFPRLKSAKNRVRLAKIGKIGKISAKQGGFCLRVVVLRICA